MFWESIILSLWSVNCCVPVSFSPNMLPHLWRPGEAICVPQDCVISKYSYFFSLMWLSGTATQLHESSLFRNLSLSRFLGMSSGGDAAAAGPVEVQPVGAAPLQNVPDAGRSYWDIAKMLIGRALFMYLVTSFLSSRRSTPVNTTTSPDGDAVIAKGGQNLFGPFMPMVRSMNWQRHSTYLCAFGQDLYAYISEKPKFYKFDEASLFWRENGILYGDWTAGPDSDGAYKKSSVIEVPEVRHVVTYYALVDWCQVWW